MYKELTIIIILLYSIYHLITGERGLIAMLDIDDKIRSHQQQLAVITEQANVLQTKINNLQNFTDPDLIEELIRDKFNLSNENDIIIQLE